MKKTIPLFMAGLLLAGCSTVDLAADGITHYCAATTWQERAAIRARVNERVAPHRVVIDCAGGDDAVSE
ncbi:hypothetical protein [Pseudomonas sp.]|uniref:hypothetical protein n=1 Tax=Pseudomonas sp. TaxID=306 RepID=UPI003F34AC9C